MDSTVAQRVAKTALDHYENILPQKAKPKDNEWTVYAALVVRRTNDDSYSIVSSATGTKCTAQEGDWVLHDSHAEVLCRRGLLFVLWQEIRGEQSLSLLDKVHDGLYILSKDVELHLYVSDSPCGDATLYRVDDDENPQNELQFTGAKLIVSGATSTDQNLSALPSNGVAVARERVQTVGQLRTKAGRSNLPADRRSTSYSCSDKLLRWSVLGWQGRLLDRYIAEPVRITSVIVSQDPRLEDPAPQVQALQRAIPERVQATQAALQTHTDPSIHQFTIPTPQVAVVKLSYAHGKSASRKRSLGGPIPRTSPCGVSHNWQGTDRTVELTVGARGLKQGKKPTTLEDVQKQHSRLCRAALSDNTKSDRWTHVRQALTTLENPLRFYSNT